MGSREDLERMFIENYGLVYWVFSKHFPHITPDEDLLQEGAIGLWKACVAYNPERAKFATLAVPCILNSFRIEFRRRRKNRDFGPDSSVSLNTPLKNAENRGEFTLADVIPDKNDYFSSIDMQFAKFVDSLEKRDRDILRIQSMGLTQRESGEALGVSQSYYSRLLKALKDKYIEWIGGVDNE